jgi:hypothetical protein
MDQRGNSFVIIIILLDGSINNTKQPWDKNFYSMIIYVIIKLIMNIKPPIPLLFLLFNIPVGVQWHSNELLIQESPLPSAPLTIFQSKPAPKVIIIEKTQQPLKKKTNKIQRSWLLMVIDKVVALVKFIAPYLKPLAISLIIVIVIRLNNGSLTGTEIKKILYFFPPKNN